VSPTPWLEQTGHAGIFFAYIFVAILLVVSFRLKTSSQGRALLAVRENEIAAEAMGVVTARAKISAFVIAAFFAGVAGGLFGHQSTLSPSELGFQKSIDVVIMVVLGGMGSISGAVLAAILLTLMPEIFREFSQYRMIVYAVALVLIMIARPQGLFGTKEIWQTAWWQRLFGGLAKK
jgi:branched-chain amino acid transport system permease protein